MASLQLLQCIAFIITFSKPVHAMSHLKLTTIYKYLKNNTNV